MIRKYGNSMEAIQGMVNMGHVMLIIHETLVYDRNRCSCRSREILSIEADLEEVKKQDQVRFSHMISVRDTISPPCLLLKKRYEFLTMAD